MTDDVLARLRRADPYPASPSYPEQTIATTLRAILDSDADDTPEAASGTVRRRPTGRRPHRAVLLSVAAVLAISGGLAITLDLNAGRHAPATTAATPPRLPGADWQRFTDRNYRIRFDYPAAWHPYPHEWASSFSSSVIYLSTQQVPSPCKTTHPSGNIEINCGSPHMHLAPDGVLIIWTETGFPHTPGGPGALDNGPGEPTTIAGHAARIVVGSAGDTCSGVGAATSVRAEIARTVRPSYETFDMRACLGPADRAENTRAVLAMLGSVRIGDL